jgi:type I restriction enzyme S subunit
VSRITELKDDVAADLRSLPIGWCWAALGDLGLVRLGKTPRKSDYRSAGEWKIVKFRDVDEHGHIDWDNDDKGYIYPSSEVLATLKEINEGDVLVTASAHMSEHIGKKVGIVSNIPLKYKAAYVVGEILQVRANDDIDPKWIFYYLRSSSGFKAIQKRVNGVHLITSRANHIEIPLAPLDQQRRIVAEIEKQFSRLDEAVAGLKRVKANLKRYKAAVLKAAVEGKLTEEWRKTHPEVEPASEMIKRALIERKKKWMAESPGKKYKEPAEAENSSALELPREWAWVTWDAILSFDKGAFKRGPFGSALKKTIFVQSGYKVYEQYCPINDDCSFARYFVTEKKFRELEAFSVQARDFLISCSGVTLGRITQVPDEYEKGIINQALLRVRLNNNVIDDIYFKMLFRSPYFQEKMFDNSTGSAIPNVKGVDDLKAIPLPLPPKIEQQAIIEALEERMSVILEIENQVDSNLSRAERLRQTILRSAFAGQLLNDMEALQHDRNKIIEGEA